MATKIKQTAGRGFVAPNEERRFVALKTLKWGDGWLQPGDEVPMEDGRRYGSMVRHGMISQVVEPAEKPAGRRR
jgi:hypothetical protein